MARRIRSRRPRFELGVTRVDRETGERAGRDVLAELALARRGRRVRDVARVVAARRGFQRVEADLAVVLHGLARRRHAHVGRLLRIARAPAARGREPAFTAAAAVEILARSNAEFIRTSSSVIVAPQTRRRRPPSAPCRARRGARETDDDGALHREHLVRADQAELAAQHRMYVAVAMSDVPTP